MKYYNKQQQPKAACAPFCLRLVVLEVERELTLAIYRWKHCTVEGWETWDYTVGLGRVKEEHPE